MGTRGLSVQFRWQMQTGASEGKGVLTMPFPYLDAIERMLEYAAKNPAMATFAFVSVGVLIREMLNLAGNE